MKSTIEIRRYCERDLDGGRHTSRTLEVREGEPMAIRNEVFAEAARCLCGAPLRRAMLWREVKREDGAGKG